MKSKKKNKKPQYPVETEEKKPAIRETSFLKGCITIRVKHELKEKQKKFLRCVSNPHTKAVFIDGLWGTSKSWLAVLAALQALGRQEVDEIIYVRNPIESTTHGKIGFLKGSTEEKLEPYIAPLKDKFREFLSTRDASMVLESHAQGLPMGFVRGLNWENKFVIVDEAQCLTKDDIFLLLTRCAQNTKIVLIGDSVMQDDIKGHSGFRHVFDILADEESKKNGIMTYEFRDRSDIVRSDFVKFVLDKIIMSEAGQ